MLMIDVDGARIFRLSLRLAADTLNGATSAMSNLGLEPKEFFVLDGIEERPYPAELARSLAMPKATMTSYVKALEAKNFITRALDAKDLRRHHLALTPLGRDVLEQARTHLFERYKERLTRLNACERTTFAHLLERLVI
jgi:DNA-binding MarR family transcriptional regulator